MLHAGVFLLLPEFLALKHENRILYVCGFSMMEQDRLCAVWPTENWLGSLLNQIQGLTTVRESYSCALEQGPLVAALTHSEAESVSESDDNSSI